MEMVACTSSGVKILGRIWRVHSPFDSLANVNIVEWRNLCVEHEPKEAQSRCLFVNKTGIRLRGSHLGRAKIIGYVDVTGFKVRVHHALIGNGNVANRLQVRQDVPLGIFHPVMRILHEGKVIALHPFFEQKWAGTGVHRAVCQAAPQFLHGCRRKDHPGAVGQRCQQGSKRLLQRELHMGRIDCRHRFHAGYFAVTRRCRRIQYSVDVEDNRVGIERCAILKLHVGTQGEYKLCRRRVRLRCREVWPDGIVGLEPDQRVVNVQHDLAVVQRCRL
jgi:hypothetical protein